VMDFLVMPTARADDIAGLRVVGVVIVEASRLAASEDLAHGRHFNFAAAERGLRFLVSSDYLWFPLTV
jgi:hypothetical protein